MAINFPTSLDALSNPASGDLLSTGHALQHANANDAIEALEARVGITGSADATSLTKRIAVLEAAGSGAPVGSQNEYGYLTADPGMGCSASKYGINSNPTQNSQTMYLTYFRASRTMTVNTVRYMLLSAPGGATTLARFGIYSVTEATGALVALLGSTTNDTNLLVTSPSSTVYRTKALAAGTALTAGTQYALALVSAFSSSGPSVACYDSTTFAQISRNFPMMFAAVAAQADLPASLAAGSLANTTTRIWAELF